MEDMRIRCTDETQMQLNDFDIEGRSENNTLLGKGSFATVYLVRCKLNRKKYALKVVSLTDRGRKWEK